MGPRCFQPPERTDEGRVPLPAPHPLMWPSVTECPPGPGAWADDDVNTVSGCLGPALQWGRGGWEVTLIFCRIPNFCFLRFPDQRFDLTFL